MFIFQFLNDRIDQNAQFSLVTDFFEATRENSQKESTFYEHIVKEVFVCIKNSFSVKE